MVTCEARQEGRQTVRGEVRVWDAVTGRLLRGPQGLPCQRLQRNERLPDSEPHLHGAEFGNIYQHTLWTQATAVLGEDCVLGPQPDYLDLRQ